MRLTPLVCTIVLAACDVTRAQTPPLDPPRPDPRSSGGACARTEIDGASVVRFESDGSCLPGSVMVLYRCSAGEIPVLRVSSGAGPALFLGGPFAVPVQTLPAHVRFAAKARGVEVLIADPLTAGSPTSGSPSPSVEGARPEPEPEPLVYVRREGLTERWLRLEGRRALHDPPIAWLIGDSILDGGRDAVEATLSDWSVTVDAEVGRSASSGVALAQTAADEDADAVVMELGTNDASVPGFRSAMVETLDSLARVPLVIWQTTKGPEDAINLPSINETIRSLAPTYPNVAIADWSVFVPEDALQDDGIHPAEGFEQLESELLLPLLSDWRVALSAEGATSCGRNVVRETS